MKRSHVVLLLGLGPLQVSCATVSPDSDLLCRELARFANASPYNTPRTVRLTTDWGGVFTDDDVMYEKTCQRGTDRASRALCTYLLENTSTEFATINYRRALSCIGKNPVSASSIDDDSLPPSASSTLIDGKPLRSQVTVKFELGTQSSPPALTISTGENDQ